MALPASLRTSLTPPEMELIASEETIEIVPLISMERIAFISVRRYVFFVVAIAVKASEQGAYGPLRPPNKTKIPLWMAMNLKLKKKCHVVPPEWLDADYLQERLAHETGAPNFSELPLRFAEIAKVLLDVASDDIQNPDRVRSLLKDIREVRQAKIRDGLKEIDHSELTLINICSMEVNEIRPFYTRAMDVLTQLSRDPLAES
ncbi:hypothetical protein OF83DRAFT_1167966 [Amylostereum chailletii]|nr:hypothetical protein OF83DRAFT_1167966 [Amylostereum chailletii]